MLIRDVQCGDEHAFTILVRSYLVSLYRFAYTITRDAQLADDVAQDVFVQLWERRIQLDIRGSVKSYLFQSTRNRALNALRHERSQHRIEDLLHLEQVHLSLGATADEELDREEMAEIIQHTLSALPPRTREIFLLSREHGMTYPDIAETLGIGIPTIHNQMSRATKSILAAVQRWRNGEAF